MGLICLKTVDKFLSRDDLMSLDLIGIDGDFPLLAELDGKGCGIDGMQCEDDQFTILGRNVDSQRVDFLDVHGSASCFLASSLNHLTALCHLLRLQRQLLPLFAALPDFAQTMTSADVLLYRLLALPGAFLRWFRRRKYRCGGSGSAASGAR